ncbi:rhamnogalacturonase-like protein [Rickenella mellea]|uniref:Rhamnogalacturonase-like protein n=1 Tax=Rickenella mellea TaxID=50990 RepID=A0A4Y7PLV1_9AGAM|nr:rhamnogalacturonase-like protein [Rickenella mellea]
MFITALTLVAAICAGASAQLTGRVGPTTPLSQKTKVCNVLNYGGSVGSNDIGPAIGSAFTNCVLKNSGSVLYVPPGNYNMQTWQTLNGGNNWAFQMDGVITRTGTAGGHMILVNNANNFEMFSSTSAGAFQGHGYQIRNTGPRILRIVNGINFSLHDLIFVDSPAFHVIIDHGSNGEIYNLAIRGANLGGSDGIDIWGSNHWVHDVEVTNRDECVTVKNPSNNLLIERIWCNQSGGSAIGSLSNGINIHDIIYRNIYTNGGNQAFMIKSNGGDGTLRNVLFQNFISRGTAYGLDVNQYWETAASGNGVQLTNITFQNWDGIVVDGVQRPPIQFICATGVPCTGMNLQNVNMWSSTGKAVNKCQAAYGTGGSCLKSGSGGGYAQVTLNVGQPSGYSTPQSMPGDLAAGFSPTAAIPIPSIPTSFYPGLPQISPLARNK